MHLTQTLQDCFDELAVFICPSSLDEQKQALSEIKTNLNELPLNQDCKKLRSEIKEIISQYGESSNPETTCEVIQDKLMNMLDLLDEP